MAVPGFITQADGEPPSIALICEIAKHEGISPTDPSSKLLTPRAIEALDDLMEHSDCMESLLVEFETEDYHICMTGGGVITVKSH